MTAANKFIERSTQRWNRVHGVLTLLPLGVQDQLKEMVTTIGCDCVLLATSLRSSERIGSYTWEWRVHRAFPIKYAGLVTANTHLQAMGLGQLAEVLGNVAETAQEAEMKPTSLANEQQFNLFNDWGCQSEKLKARMANEQELWKKDFKLSKNGKPPIEVSIDKTKYLVTHVGIVLLGSVCIGKWELGESYLVFLDLEEAPAISPSPREWASTVREDCYPFLTYLGEVNAHFDRLLYLNRLQPIERLRRLEEMTDIERNAYCRSATRLTALLDEDLPTTIETLVQMNAVWGSKVKSSETSSSERTTSETQMQRIEAALEGFVEKSYPVLKDYRNKVSDDEKARRSAHVRRQIEWTRIWWDLEALYHCSKSHRDDAYREWSSKLPNVLGQIKKLLAASPAESWFHLGIGKGGSLILNGHCLSGFLVFQIGAHCSDRIDPVKLSLSSSSDPRGLEALTFARKLVCAIRYALGCIPPDENVLRALLWLVSEIGHTRFSVDRRLDFERHLCLAAMEQPALYGLKPFYRDHLNHVIQVCLTGWMILETETLDANRHTSKVADAFLSPSQNYEDLLSQWFVASLLHDVGYMIDIGTGWADLLEKFDDPPVMGDLSSRTRRMIAEWATDVDKWSGWRYKTEDRPGEDHGVVSALHVQSAIAAISNPGAGNYEMALTAIAHHNHPNATIRFQDERLSALLVLCDEIQEWDRPWIDQEKAALALSTIVVFNPVHVSQWHKPLSKVITNLHLESDPDDPTRAVLKVDGPILDFTIRYSVDIHRSHSVFNAWLGRSRNLQRILLGNPGECPLDFHYRMESLVAPPSALSIRDRSEPELARLWRIVRDQRIWSIHRWLEAASNGNKPPRVGTEPATQGVMYAIDDNGKTEIVMLDVRQLGSTPLISDDLKEFWKKLGRWLDAGESLDDL